MNRMGTRRIDAPLKLIESNYSGYGVDLAQCENCDRIFQISYKVDQIVDITDQMQSPRT